MLFALAILSTEEPVCAAILLSVWPADTVKTVSADADVVCTAAAAAIVPAAMKSDFRIEIFFSDVIVFFFLPFWHAFDVSVQNDLINHYLNILTFS